MVYFRSRPDRECSTFNAPKIWIGIRGLRIEPSTNPKRLKTNQERINIGLEAQKAKNRWTQSEIDPIESNKGRSDELRRKTKNFTSARNNRVKLTRSDNFE